MPVASKPVPLRVPAATVACARAVRQWAGFRAASIRTHLLALVLAIALPLALAVAWGIHADRQQSVAHNRAMLRTLVASLAGSTSTRIADAKRILERVAARPMVRQVDPDRCDPAIRDAHDLISTYTNLVIIDAGGQVICSALPMPAGRPINLSALQGFQRLLREQRFTVGEPHVGSISGKWIAALMAPIWSDAHRLIGAAELPLDLNGLDADLPSDLLPPDSHHGFLSLDGDHVWRRPAAEGLIGGRCNDPACQRMLQGEGSEFEATGPDGQLRFYSLQRMPTEGWIAYVSVLASDLHAEADLRAALHSAVALAAVVALLLLACAMTRRIAAPVAALEQTAQAVRGGDLTARASVGGPRDIAAVAREFNAMVDAQRESIEHLRIAATTFEAQQGMMVTDAHNVVLRVNPAFTQTTGYSAEQIVGRTPSLLRSGRHDAAFYARMWASIHDSGRWQGEIWNRRRNGEVYPEWLTITAVRDASGAITHHVAIHADISERKAAESRITQLACYDPLTQLPNRRLLLERLRQSLAAGQRHGTLGALLYIDLDHFRTLNDTLGHEHGETLLQLAAARLSACLREGDMLARFGGDEFVVLLEHLGPKPCDAAAEAEAAGERLLAALAMPYALAGQSVRSTASIGAVVFGQPEGTLGEILKHVDMAMFQAKAAGRNRLQFFDPSMQAELNRRAALEADLRQALQQQQFALHYQAQVDEQGRVFGAEALIRWQHPQRGWVSPGVFIPAAEDCGLIVAIGHWVLETACRQLAQWADAPAMRTLCVAVNISAAQLQAPDFVDTVLAVLRDTGAPPDRLKLELTESQLVTGVEPIIAKMLALKQAGVRFSLDDFGTGYSSLAYLKRMPLDQLKIDQGFVRDILTDANDAAIARMVIALGGSLGLSVIAEGVETQAQRDFLAGEGCLAFQGYLFGRPMPAADLSALVAVHARVAARQGRPALQDA